MPKEKSIGAVVFRIENKKTFFLLLRYKAGHWGFTKGHVENNETEHQTLEREIKEETGLEKFNLVNGFKEKVSYFFRSKNQNVFKEVVFYLIETNEKEIKISFEHSEFAWKSFGEAMQQLTFENTRNVLVKANEFLSH